MPGIIAGFDAAPGPARSRLQSASGRILRPFFTFRHGGSDSMSLNIRERLAAARAADAPELGQAYVRMAVSGSLQLCFAVSYLGDGTLDGREASYILLGFACML